MALVESKLQPELCRRKSRHTLPPSLNIGAISGGQQPSSVADHCVVRMDRRWTPEEDLKKVFAEFYELFDILKKEDPLFCAEIKRDSRNMKTMTHVPNVVPKNSALVRSLERSVSLVTGESAKITTFWGWTDAALMTHFGKVPTVVFGPGGKGAHARTEYVNVSDLHSCLAVYANTALDMCG